MIFAEILISIAPIFLLIILGYGLRRGGIPSVEFWNLNNKLVYWVLFPALLFSKTSVIALSGDIILSYAIVIYGGFGSAVLFALLAGKLFRFDSPVASSVLQGAARHNSFIALAVAERLFDSAGLSLAAVITALLIPVTNITVVTLIVVLVQGRGEKGVVQAILKDLIRNPLLIAVVLGIAINILGVAPIPVVHDLTGILGNAALPIMLLGVGANIQIRAMGKLGLPTGISIVGKMLVFPLVIMLLAKLIDLPEMVAMIAVIFGAVPTAASAYTLAKQMGGDAPLMAAIITIQTALSFLLLPLTLFAVQSILF